MSQWISFASGSSSPVNPDNSFESLGFGTSGALTNVLGGAANTKGSYSTIGTTSNQWSGFWLIGGQSDNAGARVLADVSIDNGSTVKVPNVYLRPGSGGNASNSTALFFPINVPSSSVIRVRMQDSSGGTNMGFAVRGVITNANSPPCFDNAEALTAVTATTRASSINTALVSSVAWTEQVASTARAYGAMMMLPGDSTVDPTNQIMNLALATGAAASETEVWRQALSVLAANPYYRGDDTQLIQKSFASGVRLSACALAASPGTSTVCVGLYGFY